MAEESNGNLSRRDVLEQFGAIAIFSPSLRRFMMGKAFMLSRAHGSCLGRC